MGPAANAFRKEVRDWLAKHWTPERQAAHLRKPFKDRGYDNEFSKLMGRDGWIGVGWPKEFGGQGRSDLDNIARCDAEIVALCDVDHARAGDIFQKHPQAKAFKDFRKMLDEMEKDRRHGLGYIREWQ